MILRIGLRSCAVTRQPLSDVQLDQLHVLSWVPGAKIVDIESRKDLRFKSTPSIQNGSQNSN